MKNKLQFKPVLKWTFYSAFGVLFITGVGWLFQPLPWMMKVHGAAAMVSLMTLGWLIPTHIIRGWVSKKNRLGGIVILATCVILAVTGYGLYYFGGDVVRSTTSGIHWGLGVAFPVILIVHIVAGRKP
jgi:hypothetical protein